MAPLRFVGREHELQCYQNLLKTSSPWVMVITGQGGNGKSTLLRRFAEQTPHDIAMVIKLDFIHSELCVDALAVLEELAEQLKHYCSKPSNQSFRETLAWGRRELATAKHMSETIIASDSATVTGNQLMMQGVTIEQRRQVRASVRKMLFEMMDTLRVLRVVLMLDTCERLQESEKSGMSEIGEWVMNDLLPGLQTRLQRRQRQCLAVIASRVHPHLEAIDELERQHVALPMLDEPAVDTYLQSAGMSDIALRQHVYKLTHGHALCVSIIATIWREHGEQSITVADLPLLKEHFTERALLKFVGERILDKYLKSPFRELTRYGVLLRSFNWPMLKAVFADVLPESETSERFQQLLRYPYVGSLGKHRYAFHDLLREIQAVEIREQEPPQWEQYHRKALGYLAKEAPNLPDRYYHAIALDQDQGMTEWWDAIQRAYICDEWEEFGALLLVAQDKTLKLTPGNQAKCFQWQGLFHHKRYHMPATLQSYEQALGLFRQVGSTLGEANVLKAIGDVQQFRHESDAALLSYQQALDLFRQIGYRLGEANVLQAIGDLQQFRDERDAALLSYQQALDLFRQVGFKVR